MARPIQATPKLNKEQTVCFINRLWNEQDDKEIISLSDSVREAEEERKASRTAQCAEFAYRLASEIKGKNAFTSY